MKSQPKGDILLDVDKDELYGDEVIFLRLWQLGIYTGSCRILEKLNRASGVGFGSDGWD